ncbi:MAG: thioredoxin-like domain-containing protein [Mucilaginibacter sp.]
MKKIAVLLVLFSSTFYVVFGQNAVLHIELKNGKTVSSYLNILNQPKYSSFNLIIKDSNTASCTLKLSRPEFVQLFCVDSSDLEHKRFNYLLYLSPGDNLKLKADFNEQEYGIKVSGKGSNNNQPLLSAMEIVDLHGFYNDTVPNRIIGVINAAQKVRERNLEKYIKLYNPSLSYIKDWKMNLLYYASDLFYNCKVTNKNYVWEAYYRNYSQWQKITDSLFAAAKLNNDAALNTFHYDELISGFLFAEKVNLADQEYRTPEAFYREWYHTDTFEGKKLFSADRKNLVYEKIIDRYFTGKTAEFLYALLFSRATDQSNPVNIPAIFNRFKQKYPNSAYIAQFSGHMDSIIDQQKHPLNEKMVFMAGNGTKLNTLDEVLAAMKGKTVLVDMWGTWCGPCREEIEKNSAAIREHFKGKGLTYLYIANDDLGNQEQWKKLIAYFNMEGMHMLANGILSEDINTKLKKTGVPIEFIIKKDGSFELSRTDFPMNREILIKQLEEALAL